MEHIFFEVQLCIKISIFKEISNIDILIILCLLTGLYFLSNFIEVKDHRTGYFIPVRYGLGIWPDADQSVSTG